MRFDELELDENLMAGITDAGFTECTEVQAEAFVHTLKGRDVAVQSQTGTGKTAAFLISIFQLLTTDPRYKDRRVLIVAPTRELAVQIETEAKLLGKHLPFRVGCFYGGVGYGKQEEMLQEKVEIVVGTPGRLIDFNKSKKLDLREMGIAVIDEADRLFDMGFYPDIRYMMKKMVPREERMTMLFSATLSTRVRNLAWEYMNNPAEIEIRPENITVESIDQTLYHVARSEKMKLLLGILERDKPENVLIFTNTKRASEEVAKRLELNGYRARFVMGDLPQSKRLKLINEMKEGKLRYLVATDVAARGLHVDSLAMVVNYDLPEDPESYVHRIGRTARVGREGKAISLADEFFVFGLESIEGFIGRRIPTQRVSDDLLVEDKSAGVRIYFDRHDPPRGGSKPGRTPNRSGPPSRRSSQPNKRPTQPHKPGTPPAHKRHARPAGAPHPGAKPEAKAGGKSRPRDAGRTGEKPASPKRSQSLDERLEHYKEKYGESFGEKSARSKGGAGAAGAAKSGGHGQGGHSERGHGKGGQQQSSQTSAETRAKGDNTAEKSSGAGEKTGKQQKKGVLDRLKGIFGGNK